jgi:hydroxymethylpyrimidine pyrophosphatase-like HAD family hydrolase
VDWEKEQNKFNAMFEHGYREDVISNPDFFNADTGKINWRITKNILGMEASLLTKVSEIAHQIWHMRDSSIKSSKVKYLTVTPSVHQKAITIRRRVNQWNSEKRFKN